MITSFILIQTERTKITQVAETLADVDGISEVYSVSGNYDLVAIARVKDNDELATLVTNKIVDIEAITKTETMLAFRVYSKHDLDSMFSIGL
ncbi:MAG: Lrp/AsnC ligand binding domain-containing protein [Pseudomonadota bacterium]|jgi:DNA-binding Lrp family transcriptional regulator|uniref:Transcriptional regulator, AsnC family n=2 Tax=Methylophaga TaxID=40222 RepID=F5SWD5_9GAMM|nr:MULTISPECIES: Lrp/AsnC ligand binding domain-containing protein [Methylophaga]EGL55382.1 transcriptional regulator, AsnC family [Methylophaga aminisulfidivorans MP]MEC9412240.1 Lrp/AsnC ligand binding domain-containing protein [Pseudomonadota bacterium]WVI86739.1 Lrp/AsnC ligand binding domain-containing protein [Methylophaga thalassica]GLP99011.1 AsnC family transcriptional regulator [Methylophaga thalassica]